MIEITCQHCGRKELRKSPAKWCLDHSLPNKRESHPETQEQLHARMLATRQKRRPPSEHSKHFVGPKLPKQFFVCMECHQLKPRSEVGRKWGGGVMACVACNARLNKLVVKYKLRRYDRRPLRVSAQEFIVRSLERVGAI